jgi:CDC45-like protein
MCWGHYFLFKQKVPVHPFPEQAPMAILEGRLHDGEPSHLLLDVFYNDLKHRILKLHSDDDDYSGGSNCITLLCHTDLDSLCTLKIFVQLFKTDSIPHEIIPVASYSDLKLINTSKVKARSTKTYCYRCSLLFVSMSEEWLI